MEKLKISESPEVMALLDELVNAGDIAEVKRERGRDGQPTIAVVRIKRNLVYPPKKA